MSKKAKVKGRAPRAFQPDDPNILTRETELTEEEITRLAPPARDLPAPATSATTVSRGMKWGGLLISALLGLATLGLGIWFTDLVSELFGRQDWVGWLALGLLFVALFAALMIAAREIWALIRLRHLGQLRQDAESASEQDDKTLASRVVADLKNLYRSRHDLAWARARLSEHENEILSARERLTLSERELIAPLDAEARSIVAGTAKRISVITAVSPLAVLDMAVVATQNLRMLRKLATLYGARPGTLGLFKLARMVLTHIVLTGGIALGDDLIQQLIGHRLMAKLSARLGEGLFNGALTARIGLAAIDVCRPLPFLEQKPPRLRTVLAEIARQVGGKA